MCMTSGSGVVDRKNLNRILCFLGNLLFDTVRKFYAERVLKEKS